jgi:hypothetical protein
MLHKISGFSQWTKYIKYSVYRATDLVNEIVRKPHHM